MRIQHNIMAMNAYRNYSNNTSALSKNLEKLSSGYKINRAGDDAAGLAISEKMRAQITGLDVAQKNAKDGISLVQTAEGALTEVHDMLNRMVELANQSANGTYDETDRIQLQKEITQLQDEIDRIADSANFNGIKLLDGSLSEASTESTATQLMDIGVTLAAGNVDHGRVDAEAAGHVFSVDSTNGSLQNDDGTFDAFEITFKNANGETKTITLAEGAIDGVTAGDGDALAGALSGSTAGLSLTVVKGELEDLAEFRELFNITSVADAGTGSNEAGIKIQAKDAASGADLVSIKFATDADQDTAIAALATAAEDVTSTKAESAGYAIDLDNTSTDGTGNNVAAGDTIKIGDTVYEFVAASGDKPTTSGATAVVLGADDAGTTQNLVAQLKKDGYEVSVSNNDKSKLIFTDMSKISEKQGGAQISASSDDVLLTKQEAAKQVTEITIGTTNNADAQTFTFNYVDENGKAQSKTLSYTPAAGGNNAAGNATAIYNALKDDADLVKLFDIADDGNGTITITARGTGDGAGAFQGIVLDDTTATQTVTQTAGANEGKVLELKDRNNLKAGDTITVNGKTYEFTNDTSKPVGEGNIAISLGANANATLENLSDALSKDGVVHSLDKTGANYKLVFNDKDYTPVDGGLTLQIGDTSEEFNQLTVSVKDCHAAALGLAGLDISTQDGAAAAVDVIKDAINYISDVRGTLGATQNRLDHTINNLSVMEENIQDAESSIRDTDVADEMMEYTKNNILIQSAQAMLAQANQVPQGVLQLLQ
nr:flagellin [uncultured Agathobaculum sp.]